MANELADALGKEAAVKALSGPSPDLSTIKSSSSSFRNIEKNSSVDRPEMLDMLKRAKQYVKRM